MGGAELRQSPELSPSGLREGRGEQKPTTPVTALSCMFPRLVQFFVGLCGEGSMKLYVWLFECARCHEVVLLCTRCLGRRRYCGPCGPEARGESMLAAGSRYQKTEKGREKHRLRQERWRASREGDSMGGAGVGHEQCEVAIADKAAAAPPGSESASVTHRFGRSEDSACATLTRAPAMAAHVAAQRGAKGGSDAQRPNESAASSPMHLVEDVSEGQAVAAGAKETAAAVLASLRGFASAGCYVTGRCSCCGREGEVVAYDGHPRIICGRVQDFGPD